MTALENIIIQKIKDEGPISFNIFMVMALYYPELGYYTAKENISAVSDYYTSPELGNLFGSMIANKLKKCIN